jgi:hypothetical protein
MTPLTSYVEQVLPGWMRKPSREHWVALMVLLAAGLDALVDGANDGRSADMPGQNDQPGGDGMNAFSSTDALPFMGRDRRIVGGLVEHPADYAERLRKWLDSWRRAATPFGVLEQLAGVLGPNPPRLRLVNPYGSWWTREPDGTFRLQTHLGNGFVLNPDGTTAPDTTIASPWDWDSLSNPPPPDQGDMGRGWIIIYAPCNLPYLKSIEGQWGDGKSKYGDPDKVIGTSATSPHVELVRGLINEWRTAGIRLSHIIVAYDPTSFDPSFAAGHAGMPDGHWGNHGKIVAGVRVRARNPTARYTRGVAGIGF